MLILFSLLILILLTIIGVFHQLKGSEDKAKEEKLRADNLEKDLHALQTNHDATLAQLQVC